MNLEEKQKFFAHRPNATKIHLGGKKLSLANLPADTRKKVMDRLAERDEVMRKGQLGILPGIKIDGKQVTKDNIHEFEKSPAKRTGKKLEEIIEPKAVKIEKSKKTYTKEELKALDFKKLKVIGNKLGTTDRSKKNIIKEILELQ